MFERLHRFAGIGAQGGFGDLLSGVLVKFRTLDPKLRALFLLRSGCWLREIIRDLLVTDRLKGSPSRTLGVGGFRV